MGSKYTVTGNFKDGGNSAEFQNVPIFVLEEDDNFIYYSPVFDLSGYGKTEEEAKESFNIAVDEFFKYTMRKKTIDSELKKLGWTKTRRNVRYQPPVMSDMVKKHPYLSEIMNEHDFKKSSIPIAIPA